MAERSLYAALISDLPTLLPACTSWEDHLWAHVQSRMESRLEQRWNELGGFWQHEEMLIGRDDSEDLVGSLDEVFVNIAQTGSVEARSARFLRSAPTDH
jgi:nuclear pore complex protein Nup107